MPLSGSNLFTARIRPTLPSCTRSSTFCIQRRWKSMAMRTRPQMGRHQPEKPRQGRYGRGAREEPAHVLLQAGALGKRLTSRADRGAGCRVCPPERADAARSGREGRRRFLSSRPAPLGILVVVHPALHLAASSSPSSRSSVCDSVLRPPGFHAEPLKHFDFSGSTFLGAVLLFHSLCRVEGAIFIIFFILLYSITAARNRRQCFTIVLVCPFQCFSVLKTQPRPGRLFRSGSAEKRKPRVKRRLSQPQ